MWIAIVTAGGWALFAFVLYFCAWWIDRERQRFANSNSHYLE